MSGDRLKFVIDSEFAVGGVARLRKIAMPGGQTGILRELQFSKLLNLRLRGCFIRGTQVRYALSPHPNIVNSFEYGRRNLLCPYEIIEFINGYSLRTLLTRNDPQLKVEAPAIIRQMAQALAWVHEHRIMHLDVKPENFLVERSTGIMAVKLTDFDLCRPADDRRRMRQMGTPAFMAPEQFRDKLALPASDVFAFGMIAYQLLSGKRPFSGKTVKETWRNQSSSSVKAVPLQKVAPEVNPKLEQIVMTCLAKRLGERYRDMGMVLNALNYLA